MVPIKISCYLSRHNFFLHGTLKNYTVLCNGPYVLQVFGGFGIVMYSIMILSYTATRHDHDRAVHVFVIFHFIHLIVLIWASVLIFGNDPKDCNNTPSTFAYVVLIWKWITVPLDIIAQTLIYFYKYYKNSTS